MLGPWLVFIAAVLVPVIGIFGTYAKARIDQRDLRTQLKLDFEILGSIPDGFSSKTEFATSIDNRVRALANPPVGWRMDQAVAASVGVLAMAAAAAVDLVFILQRIADPPRVYYDVWTDPVVLVLGAVGGVLYFGGTALLLTLWIKLRSHRRWQTAQQAPRP